MKKTLKVAAAALTMAAGLATTSASAVQITWGDIAPFNGTTGFQNGDSNVTFDFLGGLGSVDLIIAPMTPGFPTPLPTETRTTDDPIVDAENHPGYTNVSGDVLLMNTAVDFSHRINFTWDFSNYNGLPGSLVFDLGALAGNLSDGAGTDVNILGASTLLSDLNGNGSFDGTTLDVLGNQKNDGDFLFGGFALDAPLTLEFSIAKNDGFTIGLGTIPVPAPASALLLVAGLVLGRRKFAKRAA